jgi:hypothetical protein
METLKVTIKKSKNHAAWSNQFIGETIVVESNAGLSFEGGYKVVFENNENLKSVSHRYLTGIIHFEDCTIVN